MFWQHWWKSESEQRAGCPCKCVPQYTFLHMVVIVLLVAALETVRGKKKTKTKKPPQIYSTVCHVSSKCFHRPKCTYWTFSHTHTNTFYGLFKVWHFQSTSYCLSLNHRQKKSSVLIKMKWDQKPISFISLWHATDSSAHKRFSVMHWNEDSWLEVKPKFIWNRKPKILNFKIDYRLAFCTVEQIRILFLVFMCLIFKINIKKSVFTDTSLLCQLYNYKVISTLLSLVCILTGISCFQLEYQTTQSEFSAFLYTSVRTFLVTEFLFYS